MATLTQQLGACWPGDPFGGPMLKGRAPSALVDEPTARPRGVDATTDSRPEIARDKSSHAQSRPDKTSAQSGPMWDSDGSDGIDGESAVRVLGAGEGNSASFLFQGTTARTG